MADGLELSLAMANRKPYDECRWSGHKIESLETEVVVNPVSKNAITRYIILCTACGLPQKDITADALKRREKELKDGNT